MKSTPTSVKNPKRLYRIDSLIEDRIDATHQSKSQILDEIATHLEITKSHLRHIRAAPMGSTGYLNTNQLVKLANYFGVSISELVNHTQITA